MSKILLVTHISPPAIDGGSKVIIKLGDYLQRQSHQILVLSSNANSTDDFTKTHRAVLNNGLPVYTSFHRPLKLVSTVLSKGPLYKIVPFVRFLIKCLKYKPEYIIAGPLPTTSVLYAKFIQMLTGAKLIVNASFHQTDKDFSQKILLDTLKSADYIWTLTDYETKYFHQQLSIPFSKMINVGNGVDTTFLKYTRHHKNSHKNLLFIGSLSAHKGICTLIKSFCILKGIHTLTIAGQPTLFSPKIERQISNLPTNIKNHIRIIYNFHSDRLSDLIDNCDVLISPSTQESFGLVIIEAWARCTPVIAANIPASSELIKKANGGLLFKAGNYHDLAKKINILTKTNIPFGQNGYQFVKNNCTWDKIGETIWQKISS